MDDIQSAVVSDMDNIISHLQCARPVQPYTFVVASSCRASSVRGPLDLCSILSIQLYDHPSVTGFQ